MEKYTIYLSSGNMWPQINGGFLVLEPNKTLFNEMAHALRQDTVDYKRDHQTWLDLFFKDKWTELNASTCMLSYQFDGEVAKWSEMGKNVQAVHFTRRKPMYPVYPLNQIDAPVPDHVYYQKQDEMVQNWGHRFTLVMEIDCVQVKNFYNPAHPMILFSSCLHEHYEQLQENIIVSLITNTPCNQANDTVQKMDCLIQYAATTNPFLSYMFYWINPDMHNNSIYSSLGKQFHSLHSQIMNKSKPLPINVMVSAVQRMAGQQDKILAIGGTRNTVHKMKAKQMCGLAKKVALFYFLMCENGKWQVSEFVHGVGASGALLKCDVKHLTG